MIAVDTNILLRLIVGDDVHQMSVAKALLDNEIFVSLTVVMETEWVLRSRYRATRTHIASALTNLFKFQNVVVERRDRVEWALHRYETDGDFADLIHLCALPEDVTAFATFDKGLARTAGPNLPVAVHTLR